MRAILQDRRRHLAAVGFLAVLTAVPAAAPRLAAAQSADPARRPVLVELFTSEGCSSCPPADDLLTRLDTEQFVPGAQAIVLSEHVTYWNREGWIDPFSLDDVTERQQVYGEQFGINSVYTPQAVIDGAAQVEGADGPGLIQAIRKAAATPTVDLAIGDAELSGAAVHFKAQVAAGASAQASGGKLMAALAVDTAQVSVKSGENAGHTLRHVAVVRSIRDMGKGSLDGRALALKLPGQTPPGPLRLVVFVTDRHSGHVIGVAEHTIAR
jgi:hypothetical protein